MRVIAGEFRSRVLQSVPGRDVRPTPDRLRETLFNILAAEVSGCVFLDAYAGSGSVGIEALSRGASMAVFLEKAREAVAVIEENLQSLGLKDRSTIRRGAVRKNLTPALADLVFLDPPYSLESEYHFALDIVGSSGTRARIAVAQHSIRTKLDDRYATLSRYRELRQGENMLSFYKPAILP